MSRGHSSGSDIWTHTIHATETHAEVADIALIASPAAAAYTYILYRVFAKQRGVMHELSLHTALRIVNSGKTSHMCTLLFKAVEAQLLLVAIL